MRLPWGGRPTIALLLVAVAIVLISGALQTAHVARVATDAAAGESDLIRQILLSQIARMGRESPRYPLEKARDDPRFQLILESANAQAPSVVFIAIYDSIGNAVVHTTRDRIGTAIEKIPPLPRARRLGESLRLVRDLARSPSVYAMDYPLVRGEARFATIRIGIEGVLLRKELNAVLRQGLWAAGVQLALALAIGLALARVASRRVGYLESAVRSLREGRYENRIPEDGVDEFSRLARDLNLLSEQFQKERLSRHARLGPTRQKIQLLGEGILTLGPNREVLLASGPIAEVLGFDPGHAIGRPIERLLPDEHPIRALVARLYEENETDPLTVPLPSPTAGGGDPVVAIGHPLRGDNGRRGAIIELKGVSALEEIQSLLDQSLVLSRLGQMAAGVAHEIRNPLQSINFALGALRASHDTTAEENQVHVRTAQDGVQRLHRAVSGFLKIARLRRLNRGSLAINELVEEIQRQMEPEANLSGLDLSLDPAPEIPEAHADPEVIRQAIQNIVKNAIQALPSRDGRVRIETRLEGGEVVLSVQDSGPGIPPEIAARVFDLYFTTKEGGSGVGLALVRQALEMHGGSVDLESNPGEGTRVTIRIPTRITAGRTP